MLARASVFAALVALASTASAANGRVYWSISPHFDSDGILQVTDTSTDVRNIKPPSAFETEVGRLTLPPGNWMVQAKLSTWSADPWVDVRCVLGNADFSQADLSSVDANGGEKVLFMQVPVTVARTQVIYFKCTAWGNDLNHKATLWGAKMYATEVSPVYKQ